MNLKTTILLIVLVGAGAGAWAWFEYRGRRAADVPSETVTYLAETLKADKITRIEALRGKTPLFVLERTGAEWSLPGKWPIRTQETEDWLDVLAKLHSRFAPTVLAADADLGKFGLKDDPLTIKVSVGDVTRTLRFGEEASELNRFTRTTFVRLDNTPEVVQLGPGILAALDRKTEHFQQRRLFAIERVQKDEDSQEKIEQVAATTLDVEKGDIKFTLVKKDKEWTLKEAHKKKDKKWERAAGEDRLDPAKLKALLAGFPDLWAEAFLDEKSKKLDDTGLNEPDYVLTVTRPSGAKSKLLIGKVIAEKTKTRLVKKAPPPPQFGMPPKPMPPEIVTEEYRYARLDSNDRLFEVKTDKLGDIAVALDALRDPQVARFKESDVKRLEMRVGGQHLLLVKMKHKDKDEERERWAFENPNQEFAETKPVEDLLDKLAGLQARGDAVIDNADLKTLGLDKPSAVITITVEETKEGKDGKDAKDAKKTTRAIVFHVGAKEVKDVKEIIGKETKDQEKDKAYVRVEGWPRVNRVDADVLKLAQRPALAYRNRRVLDIAAADFTKLTIARADEQFTFEKKDKDWKLTAPVTADVQGSKIEGLVGDLSKLEIVEFISADAKQDDIDKTYGLGKPKLSITFHSKDAKKTLALGNQRAGKTDYYARLDLGPVFAVKKELREDIDRSSLSYRPLQLWQTNPDAVTEIVVQRGADNYRLKKDAQAWKITEPIQAEAMRIEVEEMAEALARLKAERFEAHQAKDLAAFGLDKAMLKIQITDGGKPRTLEIGKTADPLGKERFAKLSDHEAIVVLGEKTIAPFDRAAFDLLDKALLSLNVGAIERIRVKGDSPFTLEPAMKEQWQIVDSPAAKFVAEEDAVAEFTRALARLRADKYVAYGSKIDWAQYGLDKPSATIDVAVKADELDKKKATSHVLELGKEAAGGGRHARLDKKDAVVLLAANVAESLSRTHVDFLDTRVLKFDADGLKTIHRKMKDADVEIVRQPEQWRVLKPTPRNADNITLDDLLDKTFRLKAKRIHAYPAKDLKPLGLDPPVAVVTLELENAKHVIKVGELVRNAVRKDTDERFAIIDNSPAVVVLSAELSRHLVGPILYYVDRNLAEFSGPSIDQMIIERGPRRTTFSKPDDKWQMTAPLKSDAEDAAIDELIRGVQRLRADEIVAEKDADAKKFGFEPPFMQVNFKSGANSKLHLVVGAAENTSPAARRFARVGDKGPVFLLSAKLSAKLAEEFRGRKPWPTFDAAQVERVTIAAPDRPFTLQKKDAGWSVSGEDLKVDGSKVTDTLDALASLKVLRYIADAKGDLQLYGLVKPAWRIELATPAGKRELLLGRTEGTSQRFYATVAGSDAVFVIDEADSARIARPLPSFVVSEKKK